MAKGPTVAFDSNTSFDVATLTGTYEWVPATDGLIWSEGLLRLYGLTEAPQGESGFSSLVHPNDRVRVEAETAGYLSSAAISYSHTFRILRPDGSIRLVLDRGAIERDHKGRVLAVRGLNVDLTDLPAFAVEDETKDAMAIQRFAELEALYAEAPLGLGLLDREFRFVRINSALAEINGYSVDAHVGRRVWELVPDLRESAEPALRQVIETGLALRDVPVRGETPARPGVTREWREHFYPLRGDDGTVQGIGIVCEEVTERVTAERALAESESRHRAFFEAVDEGICVFERLPPRADGRRDYRYLAMNRAMQAMFSVPDLSGQSIRDNFPDEVEAWYDDYDRVLESGCAVRFERESAPNGIVLNMFVAPIEDGSGRKLMAVMQDVTARRRAQEALKESERRFRNMADNAPVMVWVTVPDGACTFLSQSWYDFTGQSAESALGFGWLDAVHPDDAAEAERVYRTANARHEPFQLDYRLRRADGEYRWAIDSARPRFGANSEFLGYVGSVIDITERKIAEDALRAANDTFRQLVEGSPFGVYVVDNDFRLAQASEGAQKVFAGVRPLIGRDFAEVLRLLWPEPFATECIGHFRDTLATGASYHAPNTVELRADTQQTESYDWKIERITMPDGRHGVVCHFYDLSERQAQEEKIKYLMGEMNHRAKNMLSLVEAVARQTASVGAQDFLPRFSARIRALSASQDILTQAEGRSAELQALVQSQLLHFGELIEKRITLSGPRVEVASQAAQALGMAIHELATNAAKYGALSNDKGEITITWDTTETDEGEFISMTWEEKGGPPVSNPTRSGFGTRVAKAMLENALAANVSLEYQTSGVVWVMNCPLQNITTVK